MNERQFRKRTDAESRARMEARREEKDRQKAQKRGRVVWHSNQGQGTFNEGRNAHKRTKRPAKRMTTPKPVRPAHRVRLAIVRPVKVLTHAPRGRKGSTTPAWIKRARNRRRDALRRAVV